MWFRRQNGSVYFSGVGADSESMSKMKKTLNRVLTKFEQLKAPLNTDCGVEETLRTDHFQVCKVIWFSHHLTANYKFYQCHFFIQFHFDTLLFRDFSYCRRSGMDFPMSQHQLPSIQSSISWRLAQNRGRYECILVKCYFVREEFDSHFLIFFSNSVLAEMWCGAQILNRKAVSICGVNNDMPRYGGCYVSYLANQYFVCIALSDME